MVKNRLEKHNIRLSLYNVQNSGRRIYNTFLSGSGIPYNTHKISQGVSFFNINKTIYGRWTKKEEGKEGDRERRKKGRKKRKTERDWRWVQGKGREYLNFHEREIFSWNCIRLIRSPPGPKIFNRYVKFCKINSLFLLNGKDFLLCRSLFNSLLTLKWRPIRIIHETTYNPV